MKVEEVDELIADGLIQNLNQTKSRPPLIDRPPAFRIRKKENVRQRMVLELAAKGSYTSKEIAELTGYTEMTIVDILRQPHTEQLLVDTLRENADSVDSQVAEVIKENVLNAMNVFKEVMNDTKQRAADRIAAAEKFIERRYGKANQPINRGTDVDLNSLPD